MKSALKIIFFVFTFSFTALFAEDIDLGFSIDKSKIERFKDMNVTQMLDIMYQEGIELVFFNPQIEEHRILVKYLDDLNELLYSKELYGRNWSRVIAMYIPPGYLLSEEIDRKLERPFFDKHVMVLGIDKEIDKHMLIHEYLHYLNTLQKTDGKGFFLSIQGDKLSKYFEINEKTYQAKKTFEQADEKVKVAEKKLEAKVEELEKKGETTEEIESELKDEINRLDDLMETNVFSWLLWLEADHKFLLEHQLEEIFIYKFIFDLENQWDQGTLEWKENDLKNILERIDTLAHERKEFIKIIDEKQMYIERGEGSENFKTWFEVNVPKIQKTLELFKEELSRLEKWAKAEEVKLKEQQSKKEK